MHRASVSTARGSGISRDGPDAPCISRDRATGQDSDARCIGKSARHSMHLHCAHARRPVRASMHRASASLRGTRCTVHHHNPKPDSDRPRCTVHRQVCEALDAPCITVAERRAAIGPDAPCIIAMRGDGPELRCTVHHGCREARAYRPRCTVHHAHAGRPPRALMHRASPLPKSGRRPTPMHGASRPPARSVGPPPARPGAGQGRPSARPRETRPSLTRRSPRRGEGCCGLRSLESPRALLPPEPRRRPEASRPPRLFSRFALDA